VVVKIKAVIDRFEGEYAVLLVGDQGTHMDVPRELLPGEASEGDWLKINFELDREETNRKKKRIEGKLDKLKKKHKKD